MADYEGATGGGWVPPGAQGRDDDATMEPEVSKELTPTPGPQDLGGQRFEVTQEQLDAMIQRAINMTLPALYKAAGLSPAIVPTIDDTWFAVGKDLGNLCGTCRQGATVFLQRTVNGGATRAVCFNPNCPDRYVFPDTDKWAA